jgi:hypothetical protein
MACLEASPAIFLQAFDGLRLVGSFIDSDFGE